MWKFACTFCTVCLYWKCQTNDSWAKKRIKSVNWLSHYVNETPSYHIVSNWFCRLFWASPPGTEAKLFKREDQTCSNLYNRRKDGLLHYFKVNINTRLTETVPHQAVSTLQIYQWKTVNNVFNRKSIKQSGKNDLGLLVYI